MKTYAAAASLLLYSSTQAYSQTKTCYTYNYDRSVWAIQRYLSADDNLEYLTGDYYFGRFFDIDKKQLIKKTDFIPLPSMWVDFEGGRLDTTQMLRQLLTPHYQIYTGFLLEGSHLVTLLKSYSDVPPGSKKIKGLGPTEDSESQLIYDLYRKNDLCIFFEPMLRTYAYLRG